MHTGKQMTVQYTPTERSDLENSRTGSMGNLISLVTWIRVPPENEEREQHDHRNGMDPVLLQ